MRALLLLDPSIRQHLQNNGDKIFIDLSSCKVSDCTHLIQCYTCQLFGPIKKSSLCPLKDQNKTICLYCSENHLSKNCSYKANKEYDKFKCSNCAQVLILSFAHMLLVTQPQVTNAQYFNLKLKLP